jgi:HD-GYP domain-containing protein (c-di-GMP phosphodiesterase class II)
VIDSTHKKYPPRIDKRVINHQYLSYSLDILIKETILPFDCYIKRYSNYVVIIQAGTYISGELLEKMSNNKEIYFIKEDSEKIGQYNIDSKAIDLSDSRFNVLGTCEERLSIMYTTMSNVMKTIFDNRDENLPLETLYTYLDQLAKCVDLETNILPLLLKNIPDEYTTHHHSTNVAFFAVILAKAIHLSPEEIIDMGFAGLLHDIGKIRIDANILLKPSQLNDDEYEAVKHHSDYGYEILTDNGITNQKILNGVRFHHERLDGSGYPKGLRRKLIPKYAQIVGMCDAFDALTTKRTFRKNYTSYEALLAMKQEMASQFDDLYINTFIKLLSRKP